MIGYITSLKIGEKYIGGVMVVDKQSIPAEFKYSDPIIPTQIQRIIYGKSLETYLTKEIIGRTLVNSLENKPELFVTENPDLTDINDKIYCISQVNRIEEPEKKIQENEIIITLRNVGIRIVAKEKINTDLLDIIKNMSEHIDIIEPFERLNKALDLLCRE